jgi:hypothetical protein
MKDSNINISDNIPTYKPTILHKFTNIQSHASVLHTVKVSKQKTQIKHLSVIYADTAGCISSQLIYLKDKLHISDEFVKQFRELAPRLILNFIINLCIHGVWKNIDIDKAALLTFATPVILWTMATNRGRALRIVIDVTTLTANYIIDRYRYLVSSETKMETEVFNNNLCEEHISNSTDSEVFQKDGQIPKFNSGNALSAEDISVLVSSLIVSILTGNVLTASLRIGTIAQQKLKSQNKTLAEDIKKFLSEPEQQGIMSEIKSDLTYIKDCVNGSKPN